MALTSWFVRAREAISWPQWRPADVARAGVLAAGGLTLAYLGAQVFAGRTPELVIAPILTSLVAVAVSRLGLWVRIVAGTASVVAATLLVALLAGGSMADAVPAPVDGPRLLLSTEWPSPLDPTMVAAVGLLVAGCTALAQLLATSPRWRLLPLLPIAVGAAILIALSAPSRPPAWALIALGAVAFAFASLGTRRERTPPERPNRLLLPDRTLAMTLIAVAVVAGTTATAVAWTDRSDPREIAEPQSINALIDPIESTVAMRQVDPVIDLMTIADRSALTRATMPARWRVAAFDVYDGQRWLPTLTVSVIGGRLDPTMTTADAGVLAYTVTYHGALIDLVPFPGQPIAVSRDVYTDPDRIAVRLTERPDADTIITAASTVSPSLSDAAGRTVAARQIDEIALAFADTARRLAGDEADSLGRLGRLAQTMRTEWELDSTAPGAGQQRALIERFVGETRRGTREQFVTAFTLLARAIGYDARIAAGFAVPADELGSTFELRTSHAAVWPEVRLDDGTWLAFDPVPEVEVTEEALPPPPPEAQSPAAVQPPIAPPTEDDSPDDDPVVVEPDESDGWGAAATWAVRGGSALAAVLAPAALVIGLILWVKWRRRRSRLRANDPADRVRGAWANATDSLVDAGLVIPPSWTDDHIAESAASVVAGVPHETRRLAAMSSAMTFGVRRGSAPGQLADDAAATSASIDAAIRAGRSRWERARWRLSLRSIRRSTRSPVTP